MLGTTIAACPGHDRISQRDDYRIADKRDVPSQPIPQATRSSEFIWDRSLSRDTLQQKAGAVAGQRQKAPFMVHDLTQRIQILFEFLLVLLGKFSDCHSLNIGTTRPISLPNHLYIRQILALLIECFS